MPETLRDKKVIKATFPFELLTDKQFEEITKDSRRLTFRENEFLFHEEDDEVEVFFLLSGLAKNVLHTKDGKQFSVRFYYPGDLIGMLILLAGGQMNFSVQAMENCEAVLFRKQAFLKVMKENQEFSNILLTEIGERMKSLYDEIKRERTVPETENLVLFRTRVHTIMEKARFISPDRSLREAAKTLSEWKTRGLVAVFRDSKIAGVLTESQVIRGLIKEGPDAKVDSWMDKEARTVQEDAFSYEVLPLFKDEQTDLVPVLNGTRVVGTLTSESFLQLQNSGYLSMAHSLQNASAVEEVLKLSPKNNKQFQTFTEELLNERTHPSEVTEFISNYNDLIHRQIIKLALQEMKKEGHGQPPVNFCFIVMGSQGRKEQAFSTDQDNGFILDNYEHLPHHEQIADYFQRFARKINSGLMRSGFPECTGGVMAKEKKWSRSINEWEKEVKRWVKDTDAEEVRDFTIFIDYRPVYGDFGLAEQLRDGITDKVQQGRILHAMLMKDTIRFRVPVNPFGRIQYKGRQKSLDIKKSALMQIVNGVRIFAIRYGVKETGTLKRLAELQRLEVFHPRDVKNAKLAMDFLHFFRIRENLRQLSARETLSNQLSAQSLTKEEKKQLREALIVAKRLQQMSELSFARNRGI